MRPARRTLQPGDEEAVRANRVLVLLQERWHAFSLGGRQHGDRCVPRVATDGHAVAECQRPQAGRGEAVAPAAVVRSLDVRDQALRRGVLDGAPHQSAVAVQHRGQIRLAE
jgi:hypothetical protein